MSVDLPDPEGPTIADTRPAPKEQQTFESTAFTLDRFLMSQQKADTSFKRTEHGRMLTGMNAATHRSNNLFLGKIWRPSARAASAESGLGQPSAIDLDISSISEFARARRSREAVIASPASGTFRQFRSASMPSAAATTTAAAAPKATPTIAPAPIVTDGPLSRELKAAVSMADEVRIGLSAMT